MQHRSNGWEAVAAHFIAERSSIGAATVRSWCRLLPPGSSVLDLGCGCGNPIADVLMEEGCLVYGIDASASMIAAFRSRFPAATLACEPVENSSFFGQTYDGVIAIGLLFLLPAELQRLLIRRVAAVLRPGGLFLFTAPLEVAQWQDSMMGGPCLSLGDQEYRHALREAGLSVIGEACDEGGNHYYQTRSQ